MTKAGDKGTASGRGSGAAGSRRPSPRSGRTREAPDARILRLNRLLRTITEINQNIVREESRQGLLDGICRALVEHGGFRTAWIGLKEESTGRVSPNACAGEGAAYLGKVTIRWDHTPEGEGPAGTAIREGRPVVIPDLSKDSSAAPWRERVARTGHRSLATCPLRVRGAVAGALGVYSSFPDAFGEEEVRLLEDLAANAGYALGNMESARERALQQEVLARSEASLRERNAFLEALRSVSEALAASQGVEGIIRTSTKALGGFVGSPAVAFFWVDEPAGIAKLAYAEGFREDTLEAAAVMPIEGSITGLSVRERRVVGSQDVAGDPRLYEGVRDFLNAEGMQGVLCVPILAQEEVIGSLNLLFREPPELEPHRLDTLMTIGRTVGLAISNARRALTVSESEERYHSLFKNMREGLAHCLMLYEEGRPCDFVYLDVNDAFPRLTGLREVVGRRVSEVIPGIRESNPGLFEVYGRVARTGEPEKIETFVPPLGIWFSVTAYSPKRDHFIAVFENITARKRAEEALRESEARFRAAFDRAAVGMALMSPEGRFIRVNRALVSWLGYEEGELVGRSFKEVTHPDDLRVGAREVAAALRGEADGFSVEKRYLRRDGGAVRAHVRSSLLRDEAGRPLYFVSHLVDITAQKEAEAALQESEERYRNLVESLSEGVGIVDLQENVLYSNPAQDRIFGVEPGSLVGRNLSEFASPDEFARFRKESVLRAKGLQSTYEAAIRRPDGERRDLLVSASPHVERGTVVGTFALCLDITERKKAEVALRESEERFRDLFQRHPHPMWVYDRESLRFLEVNGATLQKYGFTREEFLAMRLHDLRPKEERAKLDEHLSRPRSPLRQSGPWFHRFKNGQLIQVEITSHTLEFDGRPAALVVALDVTERQRALDALQESERRYRGLFERNVAGVFRSRVGVGLIECNLAFARMFGYGSVEEILDRPVKDFYQDHGGMNYFRNRLLGEGTVTNVLSRGRKKDGSELWLLENATLVPDETGALTIIEGTCMDVTDLRKAQEEMRLLSTAIVQSHEAACVTDPAGGILYVNPAMEALTGYSRDELLGRNPRLLKSGAQGPEFYGELWETILSGAPWRGRVANRRKDGGTYEAQMTVSPVLDEAGGIAAFVATQRDVTAEVALQHRLEEARELQTIGMIAGGVAHEVRNPLFAIQTVVAALERKLSGEPAYGEYLAHIKDQSRRLNTLMVDLLTLGRPVRREEYTRFGLRALVREAAILAENGAPDLAESCILDLPPEPVPFTGHRDKLTQVLVNLLQNALSFSPAGEKITVRLTIEGPEIVIRVIDRGPGIPADLFAGLFEPFQTRRAGGTGLGLAIVRRIVGAHGGTVQGANNAPPPGATFTVRLPAGDPPSAPSAGGED